MDFLVANQAEATLSLVDLATGERTSSRRRRTGGTPVVADFGVRTGGRG